jgi:hypothetical protein
VENMNRPVGRREGLLERQVGDELVVYDTKESLACGLNATAATVWRLADGSRSVPELAESLRGQIGEVADEDLVMITLDRLQEQGLIADGYAPRDVASARLDRRRFIRRAGVVGAGALALPVVQSIVAPTPAAALSSPCGTGSCESCGGCGDLSPNQK